MTFLHLRSLIYTFLFLMGMEMIASVPNYFTEKTCNNFKIGFLCGETNFAFFVSAVFLVILSVYSGWKIGKKVIFSLVNLGLFVFSAILLLHFIDSDKQRYFFAFFISLAFYSTLLGAERLKWNTKDLTARSIFSASFIAMLFLFYAVIYGFYINFDIPLWTLMLGQFLFNSFATYTSLLVHSTEKMRVFLYSVIISFSVMQFVWVANFWPFGYLTMAVANLTFYYVLLDLVQMFFLYELSKKRVLFNIFVCVFLLFLVLITSKWKLV